MKHEVKGRGELNNKKERKNMLFSYSVFNVGSTNTYTGAGVGLHTCRLSIIFGFPDKLIYFFFFEVHDESR